MKFIDKNTIKLDRELNELDKFVISFIKILEKYTNYVIISGYVSILLGRSRATEDIDIFTKKLDKDNFLKLYDDLDNSGYWCLNTSDSNEAYNHLNDGLAIRFALKETAIPNFEIKFAKKPTDLMSLREHLVVITKEGNLNISSLEMQIAFKRHYLKSDKDLEDANHIETLFKDKIDYKLIEEYRKFIKNEKA